MLSSMAPAFSLPKTAQNPTLPAAPYAAPLFTQILLTLRMPTVIKRVVRWATSH